MFLSGPAADRNRISFRIGAPQHTLRGRKPGQIDPFPGCAQATATSAILAAINLAQIEADRFSSNLSSDSRAAQRLAKWWDGWKTGLRKVLLETTKTSHQGLTRSYRQRMKCLYVDLYAALPETRSSADSLTCIQAIRDRPTSVDFLRCLGKMSTTMT